MFYKKEIARELTSNAGIKYADEYPGDECTKNYLGHVGLSFRRHATCNRYGIIGKVQSALDTREALIAAKQSVTNKNPQLASVNDTR